MSLLINLLGSLRIENEDDTVSEIMKWQKGCALLAYLIITGEPQNREHLADLLWDASSTSQSLQNLRKLLSRMRKWVPNLEVTRKQVAYPMETAPTPSRGQAVFNDYLALSHTLTSGSTTEIGKALQRYKKGLLHGFYLEDAPRFNEWLLLQREQLHQRITAAFRQLCFVHTEKSDWEKGIVATQRWLALDEFDEEPLRHLLQFLAASGQIDMALLQYEMSRQRLWGELAVEPAVETIQLAQRLQTLKDEQGSGLSWSAIVGAQVERPSPDQLSAPGKLPNNALIPYQRNNDFTGRREALLQLAKWLLPDDNEDSMRTVAICGMGGMGKTQLAVEFCYRYGRYFPGGVFWMSFADAENVASEVAAVGGERGMGLYHDADKLTLRDRVGRVQRAWQEPIPRLLIFDNCEEEQSLAEWLPVTGGCRVLVTSQRGVWSPELHLQSYLLGQLDRDESMNLLRQLVPSVNSETAREIANAVGDLPLALYLAGGFLRRYPQISPLEYIHHLSQHSLLQHPSLRGRGITHSPTDHDLHIARTFALNFEQLDPQDEVGGMAQRLMACVIAFAHGEPIPQPLLLACVQTEPDDLLATLLAADGITRLLTLGILQSTGQERVQIHRLVAEYATAELGEALVVEGRVAVETHLLQLITAQFDETRFLGQLPFAPAHLQAVTKKGLARGDENGFHFVNWLARHLRDMGEVAESRDILETAVPLCRQLFPDGDSLLADLLAVLGTLCWEMGEIEKAWPHYEEVVAIRQHILGQNHTLTAQSLQNMAILHSRTGSVAEAKALNEQAIVIYEQLEPPDEQLIAMTLDNVGLLSLRMNLFAEAERYHKRALNIRERILPANSPWIAKTLGHLGTIAAQRGDYKAALSYHEQALQIRQQSLGDNHSSTTLSLLNLGIVKDKLGLFSEAENDLQTVHHIRVAQLPAGHPHIGQSLSYLGQHYYRAGKSDQAQHFLGKAVAILAEKRPSDYETADAFTYLAFCHIENCTLDIAQEFLDRARLLQEKNLTPNHFFTGFRLLAEGDLAMARGETETASQRYERAVVIFGETAVSEHPDWSWFKTRLASLDT